MLTFKMFLFLALEMSVIVFVGSILVVGTWMLIAPRRSPSGSSLYGETSRNSESA